MTTLPIIKVIVKCIQQLKFIIKYATFFKHNLHSIYFNFLYYTLFYLFSKPMHIPLFLSLLANITYFAKKHFYEIILIYGRMPFEAVQKLNFEYFFV